MIKQKLGQHMCVWAVFDNNENVFTLTGEWLQWHDKLADTKWGRWGELCHASLIIPGTLYVPVTGYIDTVGVQIDWLANWPTGWLNVESSSLKVIAFTYNVLLCYIFDIVLHVHVIYVLTEMKR